MISLLQPSGTGKSFPRSVFPSKNRDIIPEEGAEHKGLSLERGRTGPAAVAAEFPRQQKLPFSCKYPRETNSRPRERQIVRYVSGIISAQADSSKGFGVYPWFFLNFFFLNIYFGAFSASVGAGEGVTEREFHHPQSPSGLKGIKLVDKSQENIPGTDSRNSLRIRESLE